jgi:Major Facilitator Superfamily
MNDATNVTTGGASISARRRGYYLTAGVLLAIMTGGTLPIPVYVLYDKQMGFGPLGVTVVFVAYVAGTLFALLALGDLSDHIGRRKVLVIGVSCAAVSTALFLAAPGISLLIVARAGRIQYCGDSVPRRGSPARVHPLDWMRRLPCRPWAAMLYWTAPRAQLHGGPRSRSCTGLVVRRKGTM